MFKFGTQSRDPSISQLCQRSMSAVGKQPDSRQVGREVTNGLDVFRTLLFSVHPTVPSTAMPPCDDFLPFKPRKVSTLPARQTCVLRAPTTVLDAMPVGPQRESDAAPPAFKSVLRKRPSGARSMVPMWHRRATLDGNVTSSTMRHRAHTGKCQRCRQAGVTRLTIAQETSIF